jgi:uncharacterized protein (DUF2164 family)
VLDWVIVCPAVPVGIAPVALPSQGSSSMFFAMANGGWQGRRYGRRVAMKLEQDTETYLLNSIRRFFAEEMEMDIGDLKAARILDFFVEEMGPSIYNQAIVDAQAFFSEKVADLAGVHNPAEFNYWKKR